MVYEKRKMSLSTNVEKISNNNDEFYEFLKTRRKNFYEFLKKMRKIDCH